MLTTLSLHIAYYLPNKLLLLPLNKLWEYFDKKLNALILQLSEKETLRNLVVRGKWGLIGLANLAEYFVREHGVIGGMLKGKLERVMAVINE